MVDSFLTIDQVEALRRTYQQGMQTVQEWTHAPEITLVRQSGTVLGAMRCISIRLDNQEPSNTGTGTPSTSTVRSGMVTAWEADFPTLDIRQGDRFIWNGRSCVLEFGPVETLEDSGVMRMGFILGGRVP